MATARTKKNEDIVRIGLAGTIESRDYTTNKDKRFVNIYPEKTNDATILMVKRPGIVQDFETHQGTCRGGWGFLGKIWAVVDDIVYKEGVNVLTLDTEEGQVGFTLCTISGQAALFFCDGVKGYVVDSNETITEITDVDFPSTHIPTPVYIDGYVCIPRANSADIYNCDLENPLSWTASNYITSELFPDNLVSLARQNNQIVAFGSTGTEFFYDAANATGTPFAKNTSAFLQIGSCAPHCIGQNERYCLFIGQSQSGGRSVWLLDGFQPTQVSNDAIDRVLDAEGSNIVNASGYLIRLAGHLFFVVCLTSRTFVYDVDLRLWHEWSTNVVNPNFINTSSSIDGASVNDIVINGDGVGQSATVISDKAFVFRNSVDIGNGVVYLIHTSLGIVAHFNTFTYQDLGQVIKCSINTANIDFDTYNRKFIHRLSIIGDLATNSLYIKWSDDDYRTWSKLHEINMNTRPVLHRLGTTRRRAFNLYYTDNYPLRLNILEFTISSGET